MKLIQLIKSTFNKNYYRQFYITMYCNSMIKKKKNGEINPYAFVFGTLNFWVEIYLRISIDSTTGGKCAIYYCIDKQLLELCIIKLSNVLIIFFFFNFI